MRTILSIVLVCIIISACKKKTSTTTGEEPVATPPARELTADEKSFSGKYILVESQSDSITAHDSTIIGKTISYTDPEHCMLNFTQQLNANNELMVENGLNCSVTKTTWKISNGTGVVNVGDILLVNTAGNSMTYGPGSTLKLIYARLWNSRTLYTFRKL